MENVHSNDRTEIGFNRSGEGPPVILVGGGGDHDSENVPLAPELADHFTVYIFTSVRGPVQY